MTDVSATKTAYSRPIYLSRDCTRSCATKTYRPSLNSASIYHLPLLNTLHNEPPNQRHDARPKEPHFPAPHRACARNIRSKRRARRSRRRREDRNRASYSARTARHICICARARRSCAHRSAPGRTARRSLLLRACRRRCRLRSPLCRYRRRRLRRDRTGNHSTTPRRRNARQYTTRAGIARELARVQRDRVARECKCAPAGRRAHARAGVVVRIAAVPGTAISAIRDTRHSCSIRVTAISWASGGVPGRVRAGTACAKVAVAGFTETVGRADLVGELKDGALAFWRGWMGGKGGAYACTGK